MATDEQWEKCCALWANPDGSIYSNTFTAPAPSKNFLQVYVTSSRVILRIWKIIPPTRADSNQAPSQVTCNYSEFLDDDRVRGEILRNMGKRELDYLDGIISRHLDWLNRLPRKVLLRMLFYLDLVSIARLGQVNKHFQELCNCDALWSKIYMDHTKKQASQELLMLVDQRGWKEVFFMNKLQLQMQMRRTAKESRGFFLTSHRQHLMDDEESLPEPLDNNQRQGQPGSSGSKMRTQQYYKDDGVLQQSYQSDNDNPQQRDYLYADQTTEQDVYQYEDASQEKASYRLMEEDEAEQYDDQYQDGYPEIQHRYRGNMSSPELVSYQE